MTSSIRDQRAMAPSLTYVVSQRQYPEFQEWWPVGAPFLSMMSEAILGQWRLLRPSAEDIAAVQATVEEYISLVYKRETRSGLAASFAASTELETIQSGEFDALSYGFFHSAFNALATRRSGLELVTARRRFAEQVGSLFFGQLVEILAIDLPASLNDRRDFAAVDSALSQVGRFLREQGYLQSHFGFRFDVNTCHAGEKIDQSEQDFMRKLSADGTAYALYEMGHPVILPSAVYLYQTVGEAQHHSSRTIEELFARVGCDAWETDDFDPSSYPSDRVVELWKVRRRSNDL
ncbi:MAG: hypothetical protein OXI80_21110 [Caldilineaceae bacterium]|nr:hypothetical protein [Caldilineaceae bacterium]MDE0340184.1 hypothetical protein [Caldilineaceae bacterium]